MYVIKLPLVVNDYARRRLEIRFKQAGCSLYNAVLGECLKRMRKYKELKKPADELYKIGKKDEAKLIYSQAIKDSGFYFRSADAKHGLNDSINQFSAQMCKSCWIHHHIGSKVCYTLSERAFEAVKKIVIGTKQKDVQYRKKSKRVNFKRTKNGLDSLVGIGDRGQTKEIMWKPKHIMRKNGNKTIISNCVVWKKVVLPVILDESDELVRRFIEDKPVVKTVLIRRKRVGKRISYWAHLSFDGSPVVKTKNRCGVGVVGVDLGPNKIAVFTPTKIEYISFESLEHYAEKIKKIQRTLSRLQRLHNPNNFHPNFINKRGKKSLGKVKKGRLSWVVSKRQQKLYDDVADLSRRKAELRRDLHGKVANTIRSMGDKLHIEQNHIKKWQQDKKLSKLVTRYAPASLVTFLTQKFGIENTLFLNTYATTLSQICPNCLKKQKKPLGERVHECDCGCVLDRDITSAFLAYCCTDENTLQESRVQQLYKEYGIFLEASCNTIQPVLDRRSKVGCGLPQKDNECHNLVTWEIEKSAA